MDTMNEIIKNNAGLLTSLLIYREFNFEQATRFLPQAANAAMAVVKKEDLACMSLAGTPLSLEALLQKIDINLLAVTAAIEPELARSGVAALLPKLLELLGNGERGFTAAQGDRTMLLGAINGVSSVEVYRDQERREGRKNG